MYNSQTPTSWISGVNTPANKTTNSNNYVQLSDSNVVNIQHKYLRQQNQQQTLTAKTSVQTNLAVLVQRQRQRLECLRDTNASRDWGRSYVRGPDLSVKGFLSLTQSQRGGRGQAQKPEGRRRAEMPPALYCQCRWTFWGARERRRCHPLTSCLRPFPNCAWVGLSSFCLLESATGRTFQKHPSVLQFTVGWRVCKYTENASVTP